MIPLASPLIEQDDLDAVSEVLASGMLVQGPRVAAFEAAVGEVTGASHVVAVSSGTAALHLALLALGIGPGDRVAVPTYSWPATANVVEVVGASCVFVDIEEDTFAMDAGQLAKVASEPLAAVLPVHPFGAMADLAALADAAPGVTVVEDAACALGARRDGRRAGSVGTVGCFSFHPRKAVTTGEGGALVTADPELADRLLMLRNHGQDPQAGGFALPGLNYRLTEMQGALGVSQMAKLERIVAGRRAAADRYNQLLAGTDVRAPVTAAGSEPVFQSYVVLLPEGTDRAAVVRRAHDRGVQTQIGTWHVPMTRYYRERYGYGQGDFPVTDRVFEQSLALPLHPRLTEEEQGQVVATVLDSL